MNALSKFRVDGKVAFVTGGSQGGALRHPRKFFSPRFSPRACLTEKVALKISGCLKQHNPLSRAGLSGEPAGAALFLARPGFGLCGHTLVVDGDGVA